VLRSDNSLGGPSGPTQAEVVRHSSGPGGHGDTGKHVRIIHHGGDMFIVWSYQYSGKVHLDVLQNSLWLEKKGAGGQHTREK
jgi:hypothetical protein